MKYTILLLLTLLSNFLISYLLNKLLIKIELRNNRGQEINEYLSRVHQEKRHTPTLGGLAIILSVIITSFININYYNDFRYATGIIVLISFCIIGLIDDLLKMTRSYKGMSASLRFLIEILISMCIFIYLNLNYLLDNTFYLTNIFKMDFGIYVIIFFSLMIVGSANAMNLTDGLDGLAGGLSLIMLLPFIIISLINNDKTIIFLLISVFGSVLGFLFHNINPAKIFMGDSGSLPLGAFFGYLAYILRLEFLLMIIGGLLVIETLSVVLQVTSFKLFKKRVFLMTPFHHHLELRGKKENSIVILYYVICLTLALISICLELFIG